jgi:hypothetical protein
MRFMDASLNCCSCHNPEACAVVPYPVYRASVRERWKANIKPFSFAGMRGRLIFVSMIVAALTTGCTRPTHDRPTLAAIKTESAALMRAHPTKLDHPLPPTEWPHVIASLQPTFVTIDQEGVDILVKPDFDGGFGYYVLKKGQPLPGPPKRYSKLGDGIYWYHPY